jgi:anti-sigma regulatory factor (Ser/Thr protein kinase)
MACLADMQNRLYALSTNTESGLVKKAATVIEELFTNSVAHGGITEGVSHEIGLAVLEISGALHVRYEDNFLPFDPLHGLDEIGDLATIPWERRSPGGFGRLIIRGLSDRASYSRHGAINRTDLSFSPRPPA